LVGGAQILSTLGQRSIENQYNNYNLYQNEFVLNKMNSKTNAPAIPEGGAPVYQDFKKSNPDAANNYQKEYLDAFFGGRNNYNLSYNLSNLFSNPLNGVNISKQDYLSKEKQEYIKKYISDLSYKITSY